MSLKVKGKVGIMTFHWAANYGAVLQAWALQKYIENLGYIAEIINYVPCDLKVSLHRCFITRHLKTVRVRFKEYKREQLIKSFRVKHLKYSGVNYGNKKQLNDRPPIYDYYLSGSDQIWNPFFTMHGQNGITLSYYLDFVPEGKRRIAFSSSFGCKSLDDSIGRIIKPELEKYSSISTREQEGVIVLKKLGINAVQTADPTLLFGPEQYEMLLPKSGAVRDEIYVYVLHGQLCEVRDLIKNVKKRTGFNVCIDDELQVEEWLEHIHNSKFVITNSYHCVIFCLLFHIPFFVVDVRGKDMSSRLTSLLGHVGLDNRFLRFPISLSTVNAENLNVIPWKKVDERLDSIREVAKDYLKLAFGKTSRVDEIPRSICVGCGLCVAICPKKCISMKEDVYGFYYPKIDATVCAHCDRCTSKCIALRENRMSKNIIDVCSAYNLDEFVRNCSSSGGVFSVLSEHVLKKGGVVYGARFVGPLRVAHGKIDSLEGLAKIRGSKYIQSEAWQVYDCVKKDVEAGRLVLFSGTPCQVSALKEYVSDSENLICVDFACHGVSSLRMLREKCCSFAPRKVCYVDFRNKRTGWKNYSCVYYDDTGEEVGSEVVNESDFMQAYISNTTIRESCENCRFADLSRSSDITLADCWIKAHDGSDNDDKGLTAVLVNSTKGKGYFDEACKFLIVERLPLESVVKGSPTLMKGSEPSPVRPIFWDYYFKHGYKRAMSKFFGYKILKYRLMSKIRFYHRFVDTFRRILRYVD